MFSFKMQCIQNGVSPTTASPTYSSLGWAPPGIRGHHMCGEHVWRTEFMGGEHVDFMLLQLAS